MLQRHRINAIVESHSSFRKCYVYLFFDVKRRRLHNFNSDKKGCRVKLIYDSILIGKAYSLLKEVTRNTVAYDGDAEFTKSKYSNQPKFVSNFIETRFIMPTSICSVWQLSVLRSYPLYTMSV